MSQQGCVRHDLRGCRRTGIFTFELTELPLTSQHPEWIVDACLQAVLQIGICRTQFNADL